MCTFYEINGLFPIEERESMAQIDAVLVVVKSVRRADLQLAIVVLGMKVEPVLANPGHELRAKLQIECTGCKFERIAVVVDSLET